MTTEIIKSLRDRLSDNFDASEAGTLGQTDEVISAVDPVVPTDAQPQDVDQDSASRIRDEHGRFAKQQPKDATSDASVVEASVIELPPTPEANAIPRPTTWKKEYLPLWEKLSTGSALTPEEARKLALYSGQREKEFATGVSTYRAEAQNAKELQEAMAPFMPELQKHNVNPAKWINGLGNAHVMLATGTPEQKMQMFAQLANEYKVPLAAISAQGTNQLDPVVPQLMQYIQNLESKVNDLTGWRGNQESLQVQRELSKFNDAEKYPHYEMVRGDMAQLLESGVAKDLDTAYAKAVRLNDDAWSAEQERQANAQAAKQSTEQAIAAAAKAKARAVSTKTTTPSGAVTNPGQKDLRSLLANKFDALEGGRV
jgi:hypothetical protein